MSDVASAGATIIYPDHSHSGWRGVPHETSLSEVFRSVPVRHCGPAWQRFLSFAGPGYMVAVGYMDPGNWATAIAGGSKFGYALLSVALVSNIMAIVLQALCARLAIGSGRDLAQACHDAYPAWTSYPLWLFAEIAIIANDVAEVIVTAIGLNLLFGLPLEIGVILTALDVFIVLLLQRLGFRYLEAFIITLLFVIAVSFGVQIVLADPQWGEVIRGFAPTTEIVRNPDMLYLAMGILGATVMPHNLYLHSAIVQTRAYAFEPKQRREALWFATLDSTLALMLALLINASILVLAAAAFFKTGNTHVAELGQAHTLLAPLLGSDVAPKLFGIALLCCGLNSTVTATLAGQAVMEGFIKLRFAPWLRRLVTRSLAIIPAAGVTLMYGDAQTSKLLIFTQVILSLQLPFAVVPLIQFTASSAKMGDLVSPRWLTLVATVIAVLIIALNIKLISHFVMGQ